MTTLHKSSPTSAACCARAMMAGQVVIIPTDTVYGLSAIADDPMGQTDAGAKAIRAVKGRAETKPFITLIAHPQDITRYTDDSIPQSLLSLWPGALTIVVTPRYAPSDGGFDTIFVQGSASIHPALHNSCGALGNPDSGRQKSLNHPDIHRTLALRCPGDEWLRQVIDLCGKPIYSTSANISGQPVLGNIEDICHSFANSSVSLAVDDGDKIARPSTIVSVTEGLIKVLRQGDVVVSIQSLRDHSTTG